MASKKKKNASSKFRLMVITPLVILSVFIFIANFASNIYTLYKVEDEKIKKENEYVELQEKSDELKTEIIKLQDPEYLAKYARENYSYSKKDEIIIKIDESNKNTEVKKVEKKENVKEVSQSSSNFQSEWIIFGCVVGFILILVYAYLKSRYNEKEE